MYYDMILTSYDIILYILSYHVMSCRITFHCKSQKFLSHNYYLILFDLLVFTFKKYLSKQHNRIKTTPHLTSTFAAFDL